MTVKNYNGKEYRQMRYDTEKLNWFQRLVRRYESDESKETRERRWTIEHLRGNLGNWNELHPSSKVSESDKLRFEMLKARRG